MLMLTLCSFPLSGTPGCRPLPPSRAMPAFLTPPLLRRLLDLTEVVLHLGGGEHTELPVTPDDADLDVVRCDGLLKAFLEGQDGRVDGVFKLDILGKALLKKGLRVHMILADGSTW